MLLRSIALGSPVSNFSPLPTTRAGLAHRYLSTPKSGGAASENQARLPHSSMARAILMHAMNIAD